MLIFGCVLGMSVFPWSTAAHGDEEGPRVLHAGDEYAGVELGELAEGASAGGIVVLRVSEDMPLRAVDRRLLGFNNNWYHSNRLLIRDGELREDFFELFAGQRLPLSRMSGTASQYYEWKKAMGSLEDRIPMRARRQDKPERFALGPLEWADSCLRVDAEGELSWTLNLTKDKPEDHADLARLFTADADDVWGSRRAAYGLEEPLPVFVWQLGNELDWGVHEDMFPIERYVEVSREAMAAVREVHPDARFAANAATAPWNPRYRDRPGGWQMWHRRVLEELGDEIDYIAFHPYYEGIPVAEVEKYMDVVRDDIVAITGDNRIQIYVSEHARWPARPREEGVPWSANWYQTHSLGGCLATAEFLVRMLNRPEVAACAYHNFSGGPWGVFFEDEESGQLYSTGIYGLFSFLHDYWDGEVVNLELEGEGTTLAEGERSFVGAAILRDGGELVLLLVNRSAATRELSLESLATWQPAQVRLFTADGPDAYNTVADDVFRDEEMPLAEGADVGEIVVPPFAVMAVVMQEVVEP